MPTYSTNLALTLPNDGEYSGTWGQITNNNLGTLLEQSISGYVTQAITDGADTVITIPNGATGTARNMFIECTGALTATRNLVVPANKKLYLVYNNTSGSQSVVVKVAGQTGVSIAPTGKAFLVCNGTDIIAASTFFSSVDINGGTIDNTPIGSSSASTGAFTTLTATSISTATITVSGSASGAGITALFASPSPIGNTVPNTGAFTTLTASSTVTLSPTGANVVLSPTGAGVVTINPATAGTIDNCSIGQTTPLAGKFTTVVATGTGTFVGLTATGVISHATTTNSQTYTTTGAGTITISSGTLGTINNMSIGATTRSTGAFTTLTANNAVTLSPASQNVTISPTGTGTVSVNPAVNGDFNNMDIGQTTPGNGTFTTLKTTIAADASALTYVDYHTGADTTVRKMTIASFRTGFDSGQFSSVANGYQNFPSGITLQWGTTGSIASGGSLVVTFPVAYSSACYSVVMTATATSGGNHSHDFISSKTTTNFTANNQDGNSCTFYWLAIGN